MSLEDAKRQKSQQWELPLGYRGEALNDRRSVEALTAANVNERSSDDCPAMNIAMPNASLAKLGVPRLAV